MDEGLIQERVQRLPLRRMLVIGVIILLIVIIINILLRGDTFSVTKLGIPDTNTSVTLSKDTVYAFNGANFYSFDISEAGKTTERLAGGVKLPVVTKAIWANDKGVLLNFDQSTIGTAVSDISTRLNLSYTEERNSTWYYDFAANKLFHVGPYQFVDGPKFYDEQKGLLRFVENRDGIMLAHSFDIETKEDSSTLLSSDFDAISAIYSCSVSPGVCISGNPSDSIGTSGVYSVSGNGDTEPIYELEGEVYPDPGTDWVVTLDRKDDSSEVTDGSISQYKKAVARNLKTNETVTINQTFGPGNFLYTFYGEKDIAFIGVGGSNYVRTSTISGLQHTNTSQLKYEDGTSFESSPVINQMPTRDSILFASTDGQYNIFARSDKAVTTPVVSSKRDATTKLKRCAGQSEIEFNDEIDTFTFFVNDDEKFTRTVSDIAICITKQRLDHGYLYGFTSVNPQNGRPTSY